MDKILTATSRGQVTLPKAWRDKMNTSNFIATVDGEKLIIRPLKKTLEDIVEDSWEEYKNGKVVTHEEMIKKYGL